jgi:catechol 2,3-dioxygenase-like lactoylglutathione lyase family enzyme
VTVGKLFHVAHVTGDLAPLDVWYDRVFAPVRGVMDGEYGERERRMGSLLVIGDAVIEAMSPSAEPEAAAMPIGRFYAKFGRHLHSVAWFCDDVRSVWDRLVEAGVPVLQPGGPSDTPPEDGDIYTHPKATFTQLEFYQPSAASGGPQGPGPFADPRFKPGWTERWQASPNPLGIERLGYVSIVVPDLEQATKLYCETIGATLLVRSASELTGTESTFVSLGPETVLELTHPTRADSVAGKDLAAYPGGMCHAMTFTVADLDQAAAHLADAGVGILGRDDTTIVVDPDDSFGAPFRFTTWRVPGDPRD